MRFSICSTSISPSISARMCSRRWRTSWISSTFCFGIELQRHVRGDGVGEPARLLDAGERSQDLGRNLAVELDVLLELRDDGAHEHVHLALCRTARRRRDRCTCAVK